MTLILRKIQNPIKFEPLPRCWPNLNTTLLDFIYNYEELFGSKFEFCGTWTENALFRKIQNFIKSKRFDGFS